MLLGLNIFELIAGAVFGLAPSIVCRSWWLLFMVPVCSILWAWTGSGHGAFWRKVLMPTLSICAIFAVKHHWQAFIGLPFMIGALSIGYGVPSTRPPDPGSFLGRFWWGKTDGITEEEHQDHAEFLTRFTIYIVLGLCFIPAFL